MHTHLHICIQLLLLIYGGFFIRFTLGTMFTIHLNCISVLIQVVLRLYTLDQTFRLPLKIIGGLFNKDILTKLQILKSASKENTNVFFSKYQTVDGGICCAKAWLEVRNGIKYSFVIYILIYF